MSATAVGVGRLLIWEQWAAGLRLGAGFGVGYWDRDGQWRPYDDYSETELRAEAWMLGRLSRKVFLYGRLPFLWTIRSAGKLSDTSGGIADVQGGVRWEILQIGEILELPAIAVIAGVSAPTGTATWSSRSVLGSDVTSRGAWAFNMAAEFEVTTLPWFVRLTTAVSVPLPVYRDDIGVDQRYGVGFTGALAGGVEVAADVVISLSLSAEYEGAVHLDGKAVTDSQRFIFGVGLAGSWRLHPHWSLQLSGGTGIFTRSLGTNQPGRVTANLGIRYGYY